MLPAVIPGMAALAAKVGAGMGSSAALNWAGLGLMGAGIGTQIAGLFKGSGGVDRWALERQADIAREFAQNSVLWRVQDAERAGIHPLAALGMPLSVGPSLSMVGGPVSGDLAAFGADLTQQGFRLWSNIERSRFELEARTAAATIAESDARRQYFLSLAAKAEQEARAVAAAPVVSEAVPGWKDHPMGQPFVEQHGTVAPPVSQRMPDAGKITVQPNQIISESKERRGVTAGSKPFFDTYNLNGLPLLLPQTNEGPAESLSEMSWYDKLALLYHNSSVFGEGWLRDFFRVWSGDAPLGKYDLKGPVKKLEDKNEKPWYQRTLREIFGLPSREPRKSKELNESKGKGVK